VPRGALEKDESGGDPEEGPTACGQQIDRGPSACGQINNKLRTTMGKMELHMSPQPHSLTPSELERA
jgi:hypothetical protein